MDEIARLFDGARRRKFLLEMATGTGKTLLCAAVIRRFLTTRNAERVLFIVDRIELAKQTMEDFSVVLPEFKPVIFKSARRTGELLGASVVVATIQSLMTDRRYREEFTPFYFDLVINDEAHRSIYGDRAENDWPDSERFRSAPRTCRALRKDDPPPKIPTTGIAVCSARAVNDHAPAPPTSVMNSRRFMLISPFR
jgi:type I site-specific restriction-modification system R (restriction) subunit